MEITIFRTEEIQIAILHGNLANGPQGGQLVGGGYFLGQPTTPLALVFLLVQGSAKKKHGVGKKWKLRFRNKKNGKTEKLWTGGTKMRRSSIFRFAGISRCRQFEWGRVRANWAGMGGARLAPLIQKKERGAGQ